MGNHHREEGTLTGRVVVDRTPELLLRLRELRLQGLTVPQIAEILCISRYTVANICWTHRIPTPLYHPPSRSAIEDAIARYVHGDLSLKVIALQTGISAGTLSYNLKRLNYDSSHRRYRHHALNEAVFDDPSAAALTVIGFIAADGSIKTNHRSFKVELQRRDCDYLEQIRSVLGSEAPIRYLSRGARADGTAKQMGSLTIHSVRLAERLISLGICPRKRYEPMIFDEMLVNSAAFWLGFFDGDGHIGFMPSGRPRAILSGQPCVLEQFQAFLQQMHITNYPLPLRRSSGAGWMLGIDRTVQVKSLLGLLYAASDVTLSRKAQAAKLALAYQTPSERRQTKRCSQCGKTVTRPPSGMANRAEVFCDRTCLAANQRANAKRAAHNSADSKTSSAARRKLWRLPDQRGARAAGLATYVMQALFSLGIHDPEAIGGHSLYIATWKRTRHLVFATAHWRATVVRQLVVARQRDMPLMVVHLCPADPECSWSNSLPDGQIVSTVPARVFDELLDRALMRRSHEFPADTPRDGRH
jgi:hypothetical protein